MRYYKVKPEYDQTYKNPRIHDGNILIGGELYTESERIKMRFVPDKCFDIVDIPRNGCKTVHELLWKSAFNRGGILNAGQYIPTGGN